MSPWKSPHGGGMERCKKFSLATCGVVHIPRNNPEPREGPS